MGPKQGFRVGLGFRVLEFLKDEMNPRRAKGPKDPIIRYSDFG